jgi:MOSC domain-containing protein YiiM
MTIANDAVVVSIQVSRLKGAPLDVLEEAELVEGRGVVGDKRFSLSTKAKSQVTLIELEALEAAMAEAQKATKMPLTPAVARRNIVTRGVALNHLVGKRFVVGTAVLRGIELCEPCGHLAKVVSPAFSRALIHRGGLRCEIVQSGRARPGDPITGA